MDSMLLSFSLLIIFYHFMLKYAKPIFPIDYPTKRKNHKEPITLMGGILLSMPFLYLNYTNLPSWFIIGSTVSILTGFIDDKFNLKWISKLFIQFILIFIIIIFFGKRLTVFHFIIFTCLQINSFYC